MVSYGSEKFGMFTFIDELRLHHSDCIVTTLSSPGSLIDLSLPFATISYGILAMKYSDLGSIHTGHRELLHAVQ